MCGGRQGGVEMYLKYSTTTVTLDRVAKQSDQYSDNTEEHKTVTGNTVAVYETAPIKKQFQLQISCYKSKRDELYSLWLLVNGPENTLIFRDKDNVDHNCKWLDEAFPIMRVSFNWAKGQITLEEV